MIVGGGRMIWRMRRKRTRINRNRKKEDKEKEERAEDEGDFKERINIAPIKRNSSFT